MLKMKLYYPQQKSSYIIKGEIPNKLILNYQKVQETIIFQKLMA
jgi:uncharacterized protein YbaR (Trm112 family)